MSHELDRFLVRPARTAGKRDGIARAAARLPASEAPPLQIEDEQRLSGLWTPWDRSLRVVAAGRSSQRHALLLKLVRESRGASHHLLHSQGCSSPRSNPRCDPLNHVSTASKRAEALDVEDDRDRAVVDELDGHARAEDARLDRDPAPRSAAQNALVERLGDAPAARRPRSSGGSLCVVSAISVNWLTTSAAPPTSSSERSKLPVLVLEDPQPRDLAGEPLGGRLVVVAGDAEQDA